MTTESQSRAVHELPENATFGPYRIVRLLGRGGMGAVYEAEHRAEGRVVALKLLSVDLDQLDARERFLREGLTAAAINHPNTVYIYGTEEIEGTPTISMELVPGGTLDDKLKARGALPWAEAVDDIVQIIDGLHAALDAGVLHRDIKPANCFVGAGGVVKIGDFGLSKPVEGQEQQRLTKTGVFMGTPVFSSPEQLLGETLDARSDIYAVGVTFFYLLTGQLPYNSGSMMQVVAAVMNGEPVSIAKYRDDVPQAVVDVVMKAIARRAADRFQDYDEFRSAVAQLRAADVAAATLWDRFRAAVVDSIVTTLLAAGVAGLLLPAIGLPLPRTDLLQDWRRVVISLVTVLLVVGVPEGLLGASLGKWILGIRVMGPDGMVPGLPRAAARVILLSAADWATLFAQATVIGPSKTGIAPLLISATFGAVYLTTVRRRNGWRMLHDILTGTRVVRRRTVADQRRGEAQRAIAPTMSGDERHIGPYAVVGTVREGSSVLRGWDPAVHRAVWIVPRPDGSPEASPARRAVSRLTRLRWVGGRRASADAWDAFEAPTGALLRERLAHPVPWAVQQAWLLDISNELIAAEQDGTTMTGLSTDSLLVTPGDRIVFLEGDAVVGTAATPTEDSMALVAAALDRIAAARTGAIPPPRHAMRAIAAARVAKGPAEVRALIEPTLGRPAMVTRMRRGAMMAAVVAPIAIVSFTSWWSVRQAMRADRQTVVMSDLLAFIADSGKKTPDPTAKRVKADAARNSASKRIRMAAELLGVVPPSGRDTVTPPDTLRRQRRLAEAYIATSLVEKARHPNTTSLFRLSTSDTALLTAILARDAVVDSTTARQSRVLVDSVWKGVVPRNSVTIFAVILPVVTAALLVCLGALIALVAGLVARRGPLLRAFQIDIVTADGAVASRGRILLRNVTIWLVALATLLLMVLAPHLSIGALAVAMVVFALGVLAASGVGLVSSLTNPSRGLAEWASGTYLVPE